VSFDHLGLAPELVRVVADQGYTEPTPVQAEAIPLVLAGRDVLAGAQAALPGHLCTPDDVAEAVLWAVTRPAAVHLSEIVVRPKRDLNL